MRLFGAHNIKPIIALLKWQGPKVGDFYGFLMRVCQNGICNIFPVCQITLFFKQKLLKLRYFYVYLTRRDYSELTILNLLLSFNRKVSYFAYFQREFKGK